MIGYIVPLYKMIMVNRMVELGDLVNHLTDQEWVKQRVLPGLDLSSFGPIYADVYSTELNMANEELTHHEEGLLVEEGLMIGSVKLQRPFPSDFSEPGDTRTSTITSDKYPGYVIPDSIDVYLLSDGRIALIQKQEYQSTSRSECAYGENISGIRKVVAIADNTTITPYSNDIANMIVKGIEKTNAIAHRLQERKIHFSPYQWEGGYNHLYDSIRSYSSLKKFLQEDDVNTKIFTMKEIAPLVTDLLTEEERRELLDILKHQLTDDRMCDIGGSTSYADNEDTLTVSRSARYALSELERSGQKTK